MINRRTFGALLAGAAATPIAPKFAWSQQVTGKPVYYSGVGPDLTLYEVDAADAALQKRATVTLPANVQYAWPHPSKRYLYVVSSSGGPSSSDPHGSKHVANAFRMAPSGELTPHGEPLTLHTRPIHTSVDGTGEFLLIAYNNPSSLTVHRIKGDGTIGEQVNQPEKLDTGIYAHQIRNTPGNRSVILVTRGNNAAGGKPEDPGSIKVFGFKNGVLSNIAAVQPGNGLGFGPRHLDFHPTQPWVFVSIERQNQLFVYKLEADGSLAREPMFIKNTLADPKSVKLGQGAGPIHLHPNGRFVYVTNRNQNEAEIEGKKVYAGGENNVAVFDINPQTGEPTQIQTIEGFGIHLRNFGIDPAARVLVASSIRPMPVREGGEIKTLTAGLMTYRMSGDGRLAFARKYDIDTARGQQFWSGMIDLG
jgi:6-phosphogluconolactonase